MIYKKVLSFLIVFCLVTTSMLACSCTYFDYCKFQNFYAQPILFKAKIIKKVVYNEFNHAIYLEVAEVYESHVSLTDTIKLYGSTNEAGCQINLIANFDVEEQFIFSIALTHNQWDTGFDITNPAQNIENYWEFAPNLCAFFGLRIENNKIIGRISEEVFEYPQDLFEEIIRAGDCTFSKEEMDTRRCMVDDLIVYPNPSVDGKIKIRNDYEFTSINSIRFFAIDGRLLDVINYELDPWQKTTLSFDYQGILILEINCNGNIYYRKVVMHN